jgi:hypothetical protein
MTATILDMTGRVVEEGREVTQNRGEQEHREAMRKAWHQAPDMMREYAEHYGLDYPTAVRTVVHSLLAEAEQGAEKHESAQKLLGYIGRRFFNRGDGHEEEA